MCQQCDKVIENASKFIQPDDIYMIFSSMMAEYLHFANSMCGLHMNDKDFREKHEPKLGNLRYLLECLEKGKMVKVKIEHE